MIHKLILSIIIISLASCSNQNQTLPDVKQLFEVDRAFSDLSYKRGMNHAFASYIAEGGTILRNNSMPIVGRDKVVARLNQNVDSTFRLTWEPIYGDIALSGEMGYTYGTYLISSTAGDSLGVGTYVSIWKKDEQGNWKFVFDAGNDGL